MAIVFSIGKWGGFYWHWSYTKRLCLGFFSFTFIPQDIDNVLTDLLRDNKV